jgi:hypothetical protein
MPLPHLTPSKGIGAQDQGHREGKDKPRVRLAALTQNFRPDSVSSGVAKMRRQLCDRLRPLPNQPRFLRCGRRPSGTVLSLDAPDGSAEGSCAVITSRFSGSGRRVQLPFSAETWVRSAGSALGLGYGPCLLAQLALPPGWEDATAGAHLVAERGHCDTRVRLHAPVDQNRAFKKPRMPFENRIQS